MDNIDKWLKHLDKQHQRDNSIVQKYLIISPNI